MKNIKIGTSSLNIFKKILLMEELDSKFSQISSNQINFKKLTQNFFHCFHSPNKNNGWK